jgi:acyl-CoA synthetase (NDP forming)
MGILKKAGIKTARYEVASDKKSVIEACKKIGYPVVMKVVSEKISHKTEVGGVIVGIRDDNEAKRAADKLLKLGKIMVQEMVKGVEIIIGSKKDAVFGPVVMFGLGGIFVELFKDVSFRVAPIEKKEAIEMMKETKGYKLLSGFRGKKGNVDKVAGALVKISKFVYNNNIEELDINPMIVKENDAIAVDARVVVND